MPSPLWWIARRTRSAQQGKEIGRHALLIDYLTRWGLTKWLTFCIPYFHLHFFLKGNYCNLGQISLKLIHRGVTDKTSSHGPILIKMSDAICRHYWVQNDLTLEMSWNHDGVIKWKHFPRNWPFVWGIHWSREFPSQRPVTRSFDVFFDLRLNKRLSKQPWGWWLETPSGSLWRQCNDVGQLEWHNLICWNILEIYDCTSAIWVPPTIMDRYVTKG